MLTAYRLVKSDAASWKLFPEFRHRVADFLHRFAPEFTEAQSAMFFNELEARWVNQPNLAGYWLLLGGESLMGQRPVGHLCSWVQSLYGQPYVLLFQWECEEQWETRDTGIAIMNEAGQWIGALNQQLAKENAPQINYVEHWSRASAEKWNRLVPELEQKQQFFVIRFGIQSDRQITRHLSNGAAPKLS